MLCKITKMSGAAPEESRLIKLPKNEQELNALLQDMNIGKDNEFGYSITDVRTKNAVLDEWFDSHRTVDIDEMNYIAGGISRLNNAELTRLGDIMKAENPDNAIDFINIMHNRANYVFYDNITDMEELGKESAFRIYGFDEETPLGMCVDYKQFGESFHDAHNGTFIDGKYIIKPSAPQIVYDGVMLPGTDNIAPETRLAVKIVSCERFGVDDDSRGIWLKLPAAEYALDRAAHRLGEESIDGCFVNNAKYPDCLEYFLLDCRSDIRELNIMAEILESYTEPAQIEKFEAVLEYEGNISTEQAINIAANLDCYNYDPEITSAEDFIIKYYDNDPAKLARADELDGEKLLARCGGKITENGFVARNEQPMEQIYEPPQPEQGQDQGITMQ